MDNMHLVVEVHFGDCLMWARNVMAHLIPLNVMHHFLCSLYAERKDSTQP